MKTRIRLQGCLMLVGLALGWFAHGSAYARGGPGNPGFHTWPDTLDIVTITGVVSIEYDAAHPMYYLDENDDGVVDYHLSFGPYWYEPTTGAVRPEEGATVTFTGILQEGLNMTTLLVFEIDGVIWREAVEYGSTGWKGDPVFDLQGTLVTVTGVVMVDETYFYPHYYLDTNDDGMPEYKLGLGPYWYEPSSGATRPEDGQTVTVYGRLHEVDGPDLITVCELDGLEWRPLSEAAPWAGGWLDLDAQDSTWVYCVNNRNHRIILPPGNKGKGNGHPWPDSVFVQFWETHPDSLPGPHRERRFIGFYVDTQDPMGQGLMNGQYGGQHHRLRFEYENRFRFSYTDEELDMLDLVEEEMTVEAWDAALATWVVVEGVTQNLETNTITFSSLDLSSYYALVASGVSTAVEAPPGELPGDVILYQNYPNPFNPVTRIPYTLRTAQHVVLQVYDLLGRAVETLVDGVRPAGRHEVVFDAGTLPGGVYFYRLKGARSETARVLVLVK